MSHPPLNYSRIATGFRKSALLAGNLTPWNFSQLCGITEMATLGDAEKIAIAESSRGSQRDLHNIEYFIFVNKYNICQHLRLLQ